VRSSHHDRAYHNRSRSRLWPALNVPPTLWHALAATVRRHPHQTAIVRDSQRTTFGGLWNESRRWATVLAQHKVGRGDRVLLWDEGSEAFAAAVFAAWRLGAIPVPLDVRTAPTHVDHALALVEPRVVVCSESAPFPAVSNTLPVIAANDASRFRQSGRAPAGPLPLPTDPALIMFTSGSTGRPKAVVHQHGALLLCHHRLAMLYDQQPADRYLCPLPWTYTFALRQLWIMALTGSSIVLPETRTAADICEAVRRHRPTFFSAIPPSYAALIRGLAPLRQADLSCVRGVFSAGSATPSDLLADLMDCFENADILLGYGSTETQRSTTLDPALVREHPTSVGRPLPGVGIAIVDESGRQLGPGELGEVVHRGDQLCVGYWRDRDATARLLRPDPLSPVESINRPLAAFSGDMGLVDEHGRLYLKGRRDHMLKPLGVRVSPQEIENLLDRSGLVREVGVVGRPHDVLGDEICAFVVPLQVIPDLRARLLQHARETMSPYMVPKRLIISEALPRTRTGKIDYNALRAEMARLSQSGMADATPPDSLRDESEGV
jgi:acyl-coenzyme A synthetase/AMP-(fatty) acid ligase